MLGTVVLPVTCKKASPVLSAETCKELNLVIRVHGILKESPDAKEQLTKR